MTPQEMQARSKEKVKQMMDLAKVLNLKIEARQRISQEGFIEHVVFWIDEEKYPAMPATPADSVKEGEGNSEVKEDATS